MGLRVSVRARAHLHHRLHELGAGGAEALARRLASRDLEGHHARVDVVVGAVGEGGLDTDDGEAREDASAHDGLKALVRMRVRGGLGVRG